MDLYKCAKIPLYASLPHFYDSHESYVKGVKGLHPDAEKHGIKILFEAVSWLLTWISDDLNIIICNKNVVVNAYAAPAQLYRRVLPMYFMVMDQKWVFVYRCSCSWVETGCSIRAWFRKLQYEVILQITSQEARHQKVKDTQVSQFSLIGREH